MIHAATSLYRSQDLFGEVLLQPSKKTLRCLDWAQDSSRIKKIALGTATVALQILLSPVTILACSLKLLSVPFLILHNNHEKREMLTGFSVHKATVPQESGGCHRTTGDIRKMKEIVAEGEFPLNGDSSSVEKKFAEQFNELTKNFVMIRAHELDSTVRDAVQTTEKVNKMRLTIRVCQ